MNIFELFDKAKNKIKYPKLKYPYRNITLTLFPAGPNSKYRGQIFVTDSKPYGENILFCRILPPAKDGQISIEWYRDYREKDKELESVILGLAFKPEEVCKLIGQKFAYCCFCGTMITSKNSLTVGYGPICADNWGLPWGDTAEDITENL